MFKPHSKTDALLPFCRELLSQLWHTHTEHQVPSSHIIYTVLGTQITHNTGFNTVTKRHRNVRPLNITPCSLCTITPFSSNITPFSHPTLQAQILLHLVSFFSGDGRSNIPQRSSPQFQEKVACWNNTLKYRAFQHSLRRRKSCTKSCTVKYYCTICSRTKSALEKGVESSNIADAGKANSTQLVSNRTGCWVVKYWVVNVELPNIPQGSAVL